MSQGSWRYSGFFYLWRWSGSGYIGIPTNGGHILVRGFYVS